MNKLAKGDRVLCYGVVTHADDSLGYIEVDFGMKESVAVPRYTLYACTTTAVDNSKHCVVDAEGTSVLMERAESATARPVCQK